MKIEFDAKEFGKAIDSYAMMLIELTYGDKNGRLIFDKTDEEWLKEIKTARKKIQDENTAEPFRELCYYMEKKILEAYPQYSNKN